MSICERSDTMCSYVEHFSASTMGRDNTSALARYRHSQIVRVCTNMSTANSEYTRVVSGQPIVSDSERANEVRSALARSEDNVRAI
jgi:hypothetical protein